MLEATSHPGCAQERVEEVLCIFSIYQAASQNNTHLTFVGFLFHFKVWKNISLLEHAVFDLQNLFGKGRGGGYLGC